MIGTIVVARPLAEEGLARANRLAQALAERSGSEARLAELPLLPADVPEAPPAVPRRRLRRRLVRAGSPPPEVER